MEDRSSDIANAAALLVLANRLGYDFKLHKNGTDIVMSTTKHDGVNLDQQEDVLKRIKQSKQGVIDFMNDRTAVEALISILEGKRTWLSSELSSTDHWIGRLNAAYGLVWPSYSLWPPLAREE